MIPNNLFKHHSFIEELEEEGQNQPIFVEEGMNFEKEPLIKIKGTDIPYRLKVEDEQLEGMNVFKASIIAVLSLINPVNVIPVILGLISVKERNRIIFNINRLGFRSIRPLILKNQHWTVFQKELYILIFSILIRLKIHENNARDFAEYLSYVIDYDSAYKTRIQDIFNETNPEDIIKRAEIKRLFKLFCDRNFDKNVVKYNKFVYVLTFALIIPQFRKAFRKTLAHIDWKNLCPDEIDRYWMSMKVEYDYGGKTLKERLDEGFKKWKYPHSKQEYLETKI